MTIYILIVQQLIRGNASIVDKVLIGLYWMINIVVAISAGWMGPIVGIAIVSTVAYIVERRTIPIAFLAVSLGLFLFLNPAKGTFRGQYWYSDQSSSTRIERLMSWLGTSTDIWKDILGGSQSSNMTLQDVFESTVMRTSLLTQTANVLELTPSLVPHQQGKTYTYVFVGIVPRFLWPTKPTVSDANIIYQLAYGLTTQEDIGTVTIVVGVPTEAYINFGWSGVILIMFGLGIFFNCIEQVFMDVGSGQILTAIGIVLVYQFSRVESQMSVYLAGILQQVFLTLLVLFPILHVQRRMPE
jgi:hypothetical protein